MIARLSDQYAHARTGAQKALQAIALVRKELMRKLIYPILAALLLSACGGIHSTIKQGYGYRLSEDQAATIVDQVLRSEIAGDRMLPSSKLVVSGYDRSLLDTHTYTASAIFMPIVNAYGFELQHRGTFFNGPIKSSRLFKVINERAALSGTKVSIYQ